MNQNIPEPVPPPADSPRNGAVRRWFKSTVVFVLLCVALLALFFRKPHAPKASTEHQAAGQADAEAAHGQQAPAQVSAESTGVAATPDLPPPRPAVVSSTAQALVPEPSAQTRQLVVSLSRLDQLGQPMTAEQAAEWQENREKLVQLGRDAVPAIAEFLQQNKDVDFGEDAGKALGFGSARTALFDALQQMGGPEAVSVMTDVLGATADPKEIALLARNLAQQDPDQYRGEVLNAVHEALTMAANKKLEGSDVGPLFEVLQKFGGAGAVADLDQATGHWKYYATMALAQLPDGAGIPTLARMAQDADGGSAARDAALQMLAQISSQYADARAALLEQVRSDKIPPNMWPYLTPPLAGDQFQVRDSTFGGITNMIQGSDLRTTHIAFGNQNFISAPVANLTPEQISRQTALIDELLSATSNPAAIQALQQSRALLAKRVPQTAASALPSN